MTEKSPNQKEIPKPNPNRQPEEYDFSSRFISFLQLEPFFGIFMQKLIKFADWSVPTLYVRYTPKTGSFGLGYNPEFLASLTKDEFNWAMTHEVYHVILEHLTTRNLEDGDPTYTFKQKAKIANLAMDLAVNSLAPIRGRYKLAIVPGEKWKGEITQENEMMCNFIQQLEKNLTAENYYGLIKEFLNNNRPKCPMCEKESKAKKMAGQNGNQSPSKDQPTPGQNQTQDSPGDGQEGDQGEEGNGDGEGQGNGQGSLCEKHGGHGQGQGQGDGDGDGDGQGEGSTDGLDTFDDHKFNPENEQEVDQEVNENKEIIAQKIKDFIKEGIDNATRVKKWGSLSESVKQKMFELIKPNINWKSILKSFIGKRVTTDRESSIKRINKKFPYIFPGAKVKKKTNFVFFIDNSGSMTQQDVELALGAALECSREIEVTVYNFDTAIDEANKQIWKKGKNNVWQRTLNGGTDTKCISSFLTRKDNKGKWGGAAIVTDGYAEKIPQIAGIKVIWLLTPNGTDRYIEPGSSILKMTLDKVPTKL